MAATEVGDVWGVGRKIAAQLNAGGVRSVLDLVRTDVATLRPPVQRGLREDGAGAARHTLPGRGRGAGGQAADPGLAVLR